VLDVACGTGVDSVMLCEEGFHVYSVDASDKVNTPQTLLCDVARFLCIERVCNTHLFLSLVTLQMLKYALRKRWNRRKLPEFDRWVCMGREVDGVASAIQHFAVCI
jgi:glycine N-methyltransferase